MLRWCVQLHDRGSGKVLALAHGNAVAPDGCDADEGKDVMRILSMVLGLFLLCCGAAALAPGEAEAADGKAIFLENKCNDCHAIAAEGIALAESDDSGAADDPFGAEEGEDEEEDSPDLSGAGKEHDSAWIADYLKKKVKLDGKKHRKRFKGSNDELKTLSDYLAGLKSDPPAN